jgi:hypothetical protein
VKGHHQIPVICQKTSITLSYLNRPVLQQLRRDSLSRLSHLFKRLEARGLVRREPDSAPPDRCAGDGGRLRAVAALQVSVEHLDIQAAVLEWVRIFGNPLTWDDLPWLRSVTDLPLILKGICHPEDVRRARDGGVDGIYCSNHGGRQANGGLAALDALPEVVEAADGLPVLLGPSGGRRDTPYRIHTRPTARLNRRPISPWSASIPPRTSSPISPASCAGRPKSRRAAMVASSAPRSPRPRRRPPEARAPVPADPRLILGS